jgi:tetratricopeptide (TPR) repeat protein
MSQRALQVRPQCVQQVKYAYKRRYARQEDLAKDAKVGTDTVRKFLNGKSIERENFWQLCEYLELEWQVIADLDLQDSNIPSPPVSDEPQQPTSLQLASDPNFVGREEAIAHLNNLVSQGAKVILIHAKGGVGKTTLARKYLQQQFGSYIEFPIAKETQNITSVESLIEERLKQLGEEPGREFGVSLDRLKRKLEAERIGVLIDNLEPALDGNGKFIEPHRRYVELLRVLDNPEVQSVTLITSRECLRESAVSVRHYLLEGLDIEAWQEFFNNRNLQTDTLALSGMHKAYGGNAKAMEIFSSVIQQDYNGNLEVYWQANQEYLLIERDLEDLVACQFNRLQQLDSDAYKFLCRMGCYRYQDAPTVPEEGLFCMLWDVPEAQRRRVVKSLRDRSLVEFRNSEYWLHPMIRAEAIARLKPSEDWETANRKAAEFWTESVKAVETIEDALKAFEAYYHYLGIKDFEQAADVLIKKRDNKWEHSEPLGCSFYRLGLFHPMISAITQIINDVKISCALSRLYNILADIYWLIGYLLKAIKFHEKTNQISSQVGNQRLEIVSFFNIGLCKIDLGEIAEALFYFEEVISLADKTIYQDELTVDSYYCLAFVNSYLNNKKKASIFAHKAYKKISVTASTTWSKGYSLLFLGITYKNLENTEKSLEMFHRAISFAEESHYTQVKGKALTGLAELYREQGDFETALSHHSESIELLEKIGAKCDLAEAYYQLGLTYQKMSNAQNSQENFDKAIQLFSEMEAPKQVEKVRQARESGG